MSPSASPAKDWPRITVNMPTAPATTATIAQTVAGEGSEQANPDPVERIRLEAARRDLEESADTLDVVAARCGLGSAETMRRVFQRSLGVPPDAYRRRFRATTIEGTPA